MTTNGKQLPPSVGVFDMVGRIDSYIYTIPKSYSLSFANSVFELHKVWATCNVQTRFSDRRHPSIPTTSARSVTRFKGKVDRDVSHFDTRFPSRNKGLSQDIGEGDFTFNGLLMAALRFKRRHEKKLAIIWSELHAYNSDRFDRKLFAAACHSGFSSIMRKMVAKSLLSSGRIDDKTPPTIKEEIIEAVTRSGFRNCSVQGIIDELSIFSIEYGRYGRFIEKHTATFEDHDVSSDRFHLKKSCD